MEALAFDLGAGSGRATIGRWDGARIDCRLLHRFSNDPVWFGRHLHWDILRLCHEIKRGLQLARTGAKEIVSMGIDSWALDFGMLDKNGDLLANPHHYRDPQNAEMPDRVWKLIAKEELYAITGIQMMPINSLYQLAALQAANSPVLSQAGTFLMIPDLLRYMLTGYILNEYTNASTTQLVHCRSRQWERSLIQRLGLPDLVFGALTGPGTDAGTIRPMICTELMIEPIRVITVGEHDTASAVVAVPSAEEHFAYLSCGTWSLLGTELQEPVLSAQALEWNFTNEGGVGNTYRLLKNIMGLWLIQECRRVWIREGRPMTFDELTQAARISRPFRCFIDPDDERFMNPSHMPDEICAYCRETGQDAPETMGEIVRCVIESLALKYRLILERTELLSQRQFPGLYMVGGGIRNELLCQLTANAIGRPVWACLDEATSVGNLMVQFWAQGEVGSLGECRQVVRDSFPIRVHEPAQETVWNEIYSSFLSFIGRNAGEFDKYDINR